MARGENPADQLHDELIAGVRAEIVAEIVEALRTRNTREPIISRTLHAMHDAADFIEREFGCDAENGETA